MSVRVLLRERWDSMAVDRWSANVGREYRRVVTELASFIQASVYTVRPAVASDACVSDEMGRNRCGPLAVRYAHGIGECVDGG